MNETVKNDAYFTRKAYSYLEITPTRCSSRICCGDVRITAGDRNTFSFSKCKPRRPFLFSRLVLSNSPIRVTPGYQCNEWYWFVSCGPRTDGPVCTNCGNAIVILVGGAVSVLMAPCNSLCAWWAGLCWNINRGAGPRLPSVKHVCQSDLNRLWSSLINILSVISEVYFQL